MPNKTIYVSDDDLPLFQRAQELVGGNLSGAIATALRRYIESEEGRLAGYEEVVVRTGEDGARRQRFQGRLLGESRQVDDEATVLIRAYQTRKGSFAVYTQRARWDSVPTDLDWRKVGDWGRMIGIGDPEWHEFTFAVVDSLDEVRGQVPRSLMVRIAAAVENPDVEDLDI